MVTAIQSEKINTQLYINGEWVNSQSGERTDVINPATEEVVGSIPLAEKEDLDRAVDAAQAAMDGEWSSLSGLDRGKALLRLADAIDAHRDEIVKAQVIEMGKPISLSTYEITATADLFRYHAGWASKLSGSVRETTSDMLTFVVREPVGVVAAITPFNVPIYLMATKLAVALAAGCTFIHKPASATPLSANAFATAVHDANLPAGVYNLLTGSGSKLGEAISTHPGIAKVAFTGSTKVGIGIIKNSADTVKHVTMELGGKSPNIVLADADIEVAATNALVGNFMNSGQVCTSGSRLIVERPIYQAVVERLIKKLKECPIGNPMDEKTFFGPVASKSAYDKILGYIKKGQEEGAKIATGGKPTQIDGKGYYIEPTVFVDATNDMTIAREEIFGPVLTVIPVNDIDEAIRVANDSPYGLASAVQTQDMKKAHQVAKALKAGTVWINTEFQWHHNAPYGGYKMSGMGRESGLAAYDAYLQSKTIWMAVK